MEARARTRPWTTLAGRLVEHTTTRHQNRKEPAAGRAWRGCVWRVGWAIGCDQATQQRSRACVLEAAALGARGRNPMCLRLATRGAHLLDRRLELRREVHGRHELIERKALRGRHGLVPGQPRRGTGLSVGHASAQASARLRCGGGREELLGCKYGTAPLVPASRSTEARSVESNWLKQTESADMRAAAVTATTALYLVPTARRGPTRTDAPKGALRADRAGKYQEPCANKPRGHQLSTNRGPVACCEA